jgi:hypothetical protein
MVFSILCICVPYARSVRSVACTRYFTFFPHGRHVAGRHGRHGTLNSFLPPVLLRTIRAYGTPLAFVLITGWRKPLFVHLRLVASLAGGILNVNWLGRRCNVVNRGYALYGTVDPSFSFRSGFFLFHLLSLFHSNILYFLFSSSIISYIYNMLDLWIFPSRIITNHVDSNIVSLIQI